MKTLVAWKPGLIVDGSVQVRDNVIYCQIELEDPDVVDLGPLVIDGRRRLMTLNGKRVHLAPKEYDVLRALAKDPFRPVPRTELWEVLGFPPGSNPRGKTVDTYTYRLRRALGGNGYVKTHYKYGWSLLDPDDVTADINGVGVYQEGGRS